MEGQRAAQSMLDNRIWRLVRIAGTALSILLLVWLLARQDWESLTAGLRSVPITNILLALALLALRHLTFTIRWSILLRAQDIRLPYWSLVRLQFASLFASNFLPTTVGGDVARMAGVLSKSENKLAAAASVAVDRALGAFSMLFVLPFSWPLVAGRLGLAAPLGVLAPGGRVGFLRRWAGRLWSAVRLWAGKPGSLLSALCASWFGVLCFLVAVWGLAQGLGMPVGLRDVAGATGLTYFISLIPFSINAYGLREISVVIFYTELGSTPEQAAALALLTRLILIVVSLPGAVFLSSVIHQAVPRAAVDQP